MPIVRRRQPGTARQDPSPVRRRLFSDQVWHAAHRLPRLPPCGLSPSLRNPVAPSRTGTPFPVSDALGFAPTRVSARPPIFCTCEILPRFLTKCTEHRHPPTGMVRVACGRCACDVEVGRCFALGVCEGRQAVGDVKTRRIPLCLADNAAEELRWVSGRVRRQGSAVGAGTWQTGTAQAKLGRPPENSGRRRSESRSVRPKE